MREELIISINATHLPLETYKRLKKAVADQVLSGNGPFTEPLIGRLLDDDSLFCGFCYDIATHLNRPPGEDGRVSFANWTVSVMRETILTADDMDYFDPIFASLCAQTRRGGSMDVSPYIVFVADPAIVELPGVQEYWDYDF